MLMTDSVNKKPKFVKSVWRGFGESGIQRNISSFNKEYECGLIGPAKIFDRAENQQLEMKLAAAGAE